MSGEQLSRRLPIPSVARRSRVRSPKPTWLDRCRTLLLRSIGGRVAPALLLGSDLAGLVLLVAFALFPAHLIGAVVGIGTAEIVARLVADATDWRLANIRANGMFAGVSAAWLLAPSGLMWPIGLVFIPAAAALAALLAAALGRVFDGRSTPILSAGFLLVFAAELSLFPALAAASSTAELYWAYPVDLMGWIDSLLRSSGMVVLDPRPLTGALVLLAVAVASPQYLVHGLVGWVAGILAAFALQYLGFSWKWLLSAHNGFIAGMLVGAVFYLPSRSSLVVSVVAGMLAAGLTLATQVAFGGTAWAFQPIPSVVTVWVLLLALDGRDPGRGLVRNPDSSVPPHEAARRHRQLKSRLGVDQPLLIPPAAEPLLVTQGFDGEVTHRGAWRHALDFEGTDTGPSILGAPVLAPAPGVVAGVVNDVADNPPGKNNFRDNWGNHVVVKLDGGAWYLLAHLAQGSICVRPGQRVGYGTMLGRVGNSGRSPVPHLHLNVQSGPLPGAPTLPFRLANVGTFEGERLMWHGHFLPKAGEIVIGAGARPPVLAATAAISPGLATWRITRTGRVPGMRRETEVENIEIKLDVAGRQVFSHGSKELAYHADADALRLYSVSGGLGVVLGLLARAMPAVPYCVSKDVSWRELSLVPRRGPLGGIAELLAPYGLEVDRFVRLKGLDPQDEAGFAIEASLESPRKHEPTSVRISFTEYQGPVEIEARFATGAIHASVVAFEPRLA